MTPGALENSSMTTTNFPNGVTSFGIPVLGGTGGIPFTGNYFFVDPSSGADGNDGGASSPMQTISGALGRCVSGNNDVIFIVGDGTTTNTVRLSETLTWSKDATHLIGITAPTMVAQRARIAPTSGATAFTPLVNVTAAGCVFANFSTFHGFGTGTTNQICWQEAGQRNYYWNVQFGGMGDTASANSAGSRSLRVGLASSGQGENTFDTCQIGLDTVTRTAANASLEFIGGTPRNVFRNCVFPFQTNTAGCFGILSAAASAMDRYQLFEGCVFVNNVGSTSTTITDLCSLAASSGGVVVLKSCTTVGFTGLGTASSLSQTWIDGGPPVAATSALAVNPAA